MPILAVPQAGLTLGIAAESISISKAPGTPNIAPGTKQVMRVTFDEPHLLDDLIKAGEFKVLFGKTITFTHGINQAQEVLSKIEHVRNEVYEMNNDSLAFTGLMTHQFEARKLAEDLGDSADLLALKEKMSALKNQKNSKSTVIIDARGTKVHGKPIPLQQKQAVKKIPIETSPKKEVTDTQLEALRIPLLHLLALGSDSTNQLAVKTRASSGLCLQILQKIGNRTRAGNHWELVDDYYRELDVWKFPYANGTDRKTAINNAKAAYTRLRLSAEATEWDRLVSPEDRGKVKLGPAPPRLPKPRPLSGLKVEKGDTKAVTSGEPSPTMSENSAAGEPMARTGSHQPTPKAGRAGAKDMMSRIIAGGKGKPAKAPPKEKAAPGTRRIGRPPKPKAETTAKVIKRPTKWKHPEGGLRAPQPTYKSKEFVDSEDEAEEPLIKEAAARTAAKSLPEPALTPLPSKLNGQSPAVRAGKNDTKAEREKPSTTNSPVKKGVLSGKISKTSSPALPKKGAVGSKTVLTRTPESVAGRTPVPKERHSTIGGKRPVAASTVATTAKPKTAAKTLAREKEQSRPRTPAKTISPPIKRSPVKNSPPPLAGNASTSSTPQTLTSMETISTPDHSPIHSIAVSASARAARERAIQASTSSATSSKRKANRTDDTDAPPAKRPAVAPHILNTAQKFKRKYAVYAELYDEAKSNSDNDVTVRLLEMHHELTVWKQEMHQWAANAS